MSGQRLVPPPGGVTVRMYRIGHGDCFLLAFAGEAADKPAYVLIDCGYKPGSPKHINTKAAEVAAAAGRVCRMRDGRFEDRCGSSISSSFAG